MKLLYNLLNEGYEVNSRQLNFLVVENTKEFRKISTDLLGTRETITFYEDLEEIENYTVIPSPFLLDFADKKILNKVLLDLIEIAGDDSNYNNMLEFNTANSGFINNLIFESDLPLGIEVRPDLKNILKAYGLHIDVDYESDIEKLVEYITLVAHAFRHRLVLIYNLMLYFQDDELKTLWDFIERNDIIVVGIETKDFILDLPHKKLLFDNDLCRVQ